LQTNLLDLSTVDAILVSNAVSMMALPYITEVEELCSIYHFFIERLCLVCVHNWLNDWYTNCGCK